MSLAAWVAASYLSNNYLGSLVLVDVAKSTAYISALLAFYFGCMMTYYFPKVEAMRHPERLMIGVLTAGLGLLSLTPLIRGGSSLSGTMLQHSEGGLLAIYLCGMVLLLGVALYNLVRTITARRTGAVHRTQAAIMASAFLISALLGLLLSIVVPGLGMGWESTKLSSVTVVIFVAIVGYAMMRHRLFDVRVAAVRTVAYALSIIVLALVYFGLAYLVSQVFFKGAATTGVSMSPINVALALVLAFLFQPIKQFFDRITDQIFFRDRYDQDAFVAQLGDILTSTTTLGTLLHHSARHMEETLKASSVTFVVERGDKDNAVIGSGRMLHLTTSEQREIAQLLEGKTSAVTLEELARFVKPQTVQNRVVKQLVKNHIALILPLGSDVGYVLFGDQKGNGYSQRDMRILDMISDELLIAIQNARSVQEVRELNTHLQQRIDKATRELRRSNEKLKKLDATKDEFISMASHQLRTPLTSIKGYLSMVLEGDVGTVTPAQRQLLEPAFMSSERMVNLIGDFLNVSRLQTGKFVIDAHPTDLVQVITQEVEAIQQLATSHDMAVTTRLPRRKVPQLMLDEDKVRQVIMNFIDNAIYYSRPHSTIVVQLKFDGDDIVLEVHDHGIGVPPEQQKQLFSKFFRADNARKQRPDGTGVGLFLARKVITAHGGDVVFESTEGKGSVFGFRLPIGKLSAKK